MNTRSLIAATLFALALSAPLTAAAQSQGAPMAVDRTDDNDDGFDIGWIGLVGLAGLSGLMGLSRSKVEDFHGTRTAR